MLFHERTELFFDPLPLSSKGKISGFYWVEGGGETVFRDKFYAGVFLRLQDTSSDLQCDAFRCMISLLIDVLNYIIFVVVVVVLIHKTIVCLSVSNMSNEILRKCTHCSVLSVPSTEQLIY